MDKLARIEARHTLQGVMEYVRVLRDAVEPETGVYQFSDEAYNIDLDNIISRLNSIRAGTTTRRTS